LRFFGYPFFLLYSTALSHPFERGVSLARARAFLCVGVFYTLVVSLRKGFISSGTTTLAGEMLA